MDSSEISTWPREGSDQILSILKGVTDWDAIRVLFQQIWSNQREFIDGLSEI